MDRNKSRINNQRKQFFQTKLDANHPAKNKGVNCSNGERSSVESPKLYNKIKQNLEQTLNKNIQTVEYVEDLTDYGRMINIEIQTEDIPYEEDNLVTPITFVELVDISTQLQEDDFYDYEEELERAVDDLIRRAMEDSMREVLEEQELFELEKKKNDHQKRLELEETEIQYLVESFQQAEKQRIHQKQLIELKEKQERINKIKQDTIEKAQNFASILQFNAIQNIQDMGWFRDIEEATNEFIMKPMLENLFKKKVEDIHKGVKCVLNDLLWEISDGIIASQRRSC